MAVFVEIANTRHLAYSPLNEKHNILYHRARQNVNQRHIHKPWFDLNPFLDKEDVKGVALEQYKPENDRGILPLESLVIVEEYFDDTPQFAKEFKTGEFWDFIFSDNWNHGYSVRVLEGHLQNLLFSVLVSLTHGGHVTQHSTVAYAKNRRQRCSIYKHSQKEPEFNRYDETLLLEFVYYGHAIQSIGQLPDYSSYEGYPDATTCSATTHASSELESSDKDMPLLATTTSDEQQQVRPPSKMSTPVDSRRQRLFRRRTKSHGHNLELIREENVTNEKLACTLPGNSLPIPRGVAKQKTSSTSSISSEGYKTLPPNLDLSKFACTEEIRYLGEFELSDDSSSSDDDDDDYGCIDYGQEYYLGDRNQAMLPDVNESVESRLRKRKQVVSKEREMRRQLIKEQNAKSVKKTIMPEFSELDVKKYLNDSEIIVSVRQDESVPDLDTYVHMLREQEREAVKHKNKIRHRFLELRKKYLRIDPSNENFADAVGGVTDSQACRIHCYDNRDTAWRVMTKRAKRNFLVQKLFKAGGKVHVNPKRRKKPKEILSKKLEIPLIYISTVSGITYLHPVSKQMLQAKRQTQEASVRRNQQKMASVGKRRMSLVATHTTPLSMELLKKNKLRSVAENQSNTTPDKRFPKVKIVSGIESPDEDSEAESDDLQESSFDTKKLNIRYSVEKIRVAKAARKEKEDDQSEGNFFDVLKKYYRMQSVLKAFSKGKKGGRRRASGFGVMPRRRRQLAALSNKANEDDSEKITIGKLKWFSFMDNKKTRMQLSEDIFQPLFETYPMKLFRENVQRALEEFVVRREIVISDYSAKASVSITFTKKSVFTKSKVSEM